jgi:ribonuclease D
VSWTLIESNEGLDDALAAIGDAGEIAVDTEFMRRNTYYPQVALLQLCVDSHAWLIDPLKVSDLAPLRALLTDPARYKILHSCSEDLEVFRHWLGVLPTPLIDSQRAAALLGESFGLGYRALVETLLAIEVEKGETRSDWLKRPLTESQCHYAAQDVLQLVPAWRLLRERAERLGRMDWVLDEGEEAARLLRDRETEVYRRIKSASRLAPRQLEVLRRLSDWREQRAQSSDKPRGWVLEDKACIAIAQAMPADLASLESLGVLPPSVLRKQGDVLLSCVAQARETPEAALPEALPGPLGTAQRNLLKSLREQARVIAADLGVAPEILVSGADLEMLIREAAGSAIVEPRRWQGWRAAAVIRPLRESLAR